MGKCTHTRRHKCSFMTRNSSYPCNFSRKRSLSYRWASFANTTDTPMDGSAGQEPRLTKKGKSIFCKTNNFVPLVVPGLSTNSGSSSSSTTLPQESLGPEALLVSGNRAACSSTDPVLERSDELANRMPGAGVPEKWQEGRERSVGRSSILVRRFHAPAHISQDSDSEHPAKVATNSRKHSIFTHFPKDRDCDVCLRTKRTRTPCRRRTGEALLWAEKFGDLTTADHKVLNEEGESRNNHRYAVMDSVLSV